MEHKDVEAEIKKKCEKCGFDDFPHVVCHRPSKPMYRRAGTIFTKEAMGFTCVRCGYHWEIAAT